MNFMKNLMCRNILIVVLSIAPMFAIDALAEDGKPNVLLLCIDDLRPELKCFGKEYIHSPNIDALAQRGRAFHRHYVQAPTCGASRYTLLTGRYGSSGNGALFGRAALLKKTPKAIPPSMPAWFRQHGYTTVSVGKVSHHPGGRGGKDWDDDNQPEMPNSWDRHLMPCGPWQHPRGAMHGLANGEIRIKAGEMDVFQAFDGPDESYPDGLTVDESLRQLDELAGENASDKPFFLAVGIIRPHLPLGAPKKYLDHYRDATLPAIPHPNKPSGKTTWHRSGEFMKYNRWQRDPNDDPEFATLVRKHYAACVTYADAQVGRIIAKLESLGLRDDTIIVLWGDHGWHLGEHGIWGKHALFEESLRSPLIVSYAGIPKPGKPTQSMVETLDIFPTLCDLAKISQPDSVQGVSLRPILESPQSPGHPAVSYGKARTIRTETHRLILHNDGFAELYDHRSPEPETENIASEHPDIVKELTAALDKRNPS
jgi:iduronate 2-sulfatase